MVFPESDLECSNLHNFLQRQRVTDTNINLIPDGNAFPVQERIRVPGCARALESYKENNPSGKCVLFLNGHQFGQGLNLETTTHIITLHAISKEKYSQLVGRARRAGRRDPLYVIHLRYDWELDTI